MSTSDPTRSPSISSPACPEKAMSSGSSEGTPVRKEIKGACASLSGFAVLPRKLRRAASAAPTADDGAVMSFCTHLAEDHSIHHCKRYLRTDRNRASKKKESLLQLALLSPVEKPVIPVQRRTDWQSQSVSSQGIPLTGSSSFDMIHGMDH